MPDRVLLRDHSQPCGHSEFYRFKVGYPELWCCRVAGCPGGEEVEFTEERVGPVSGEGQRYSYSKHGPPDVEKRRLISEWSDA